MLAQAAVVAAASLISADARAQTDGGQADGEPTATAAADADGGAPDAGDAEPQSICEIPDVCVDRGDIVPIYGAPAPPGIRGCGCELADRPGDGSGVGLFVAASLIARLRRRTRR